MLALMRHSSDFTHLFLYHLAPFIVMAVVLGSFLYLFKLACRKENRGRRKLPKVKGLNRRQRRQERSSSTHARHY